MTRTKDLERKTGRKPYMYRGRKLTLSECARLSGHTRQMMYERLVVRGWPVARAIETKRSNRVKTCSNCGKTDHYRPNCKEPNKDGSHGSV